MSDALNKFYSESNSFVWPSFLSWIKPDGWDEMFSGDQYRNRTHRLTMLVARSLTTHRGRSRYHWLNNLERTEEQWFKWYVAPADRLKGD